MLPCQRHLFDMESGVVYLDSAALSPMPVSTRAVAQQCAASKARPWTRDRDESHARTETLRGLVAPLIGAIASDLAITCSVSYGLATAARNLELRKDEAVLVLEGDHTSQLLTWQSRALAVGASLHVVAKPVDGDWTTAILDALGQDSRIVIASLSACFWLDGSIIDLKRICEELRARGIQVVIDATQSVGIMDLDVKALQPDFVAFPTYKWLLGPYSLGFLYVAPHRQGGNPLEQNGFNRDSAGEYLQGARRFDMGERDTFVTIPTALESLSVVGRWRSSDVQAVLRSLTDRLAARLEDGGLHCVPRHMRSPHILGVSGSSPGVAAACRSQGIYFTERNGALRISPHVYNTEDDIDACADAILAFERSS